MKNVEYNWELNGLLNKWLTIEQQIDLNGIVLEPLNRAGVEYIGFKVSVTRRDKSRSKALEICLTKLDRLLKIWSFESGIPVTIFEKELKLTNEKSLEKKAIVREKSITLTMDAIVKRIVKKTELDEVINLQKKIGRHHRKKELRKAIDWCVKAIEEKDAVDKFIALWVAFNIIYNLYDAHNNPNHRDEFNDHKKAIKINKITNSSDLIKEIEAKFKIISLLKKYNLSHVKGRGSIIRYNFELEKLYNDKNFDSAFKMFLECLYKIRCNLIHGVKETGSHRQIQLLQSCSPALMMVVKDCLNQYCKV